MMFSRLPATLLSLACLGGVACAEVVGNEGFGYANGPINNRNGGTGWNRAGGVSVWTGNPTFPVVSGGLLYTGSDSGASRAYGGDESGSAFPASGMVFFKATLTLGSSIPSYAGLSSLEFGTERVFFGRVSNSDFGINEPGFGQALTGVAPAASTTYTFVGVLDFTHARLSFFLNPTSSDFYNMGDGSSSAGAAKVFQSATNWATRLRLQSAGGAANVAWDNATVGTTPGDVGLQAVGYLHAGGVNIQDPSNQAILLRSVDLGSWLYPETWMMGGLNLAAYSGADDFERLNAAVKDVLGGDANLTANALDALRTNLITAADMAFLHSEGFNCVRVPFHYELFYQVTNAAGSYPANGYDIDTGFAYFDNLLACCATNGIYVIPDLHGVPGGKDYAVAGNVYTDAGNHALFLRLWNRIAARYATNAWIGGYDLLNEPVNNAGGYQLIPGTVLSATYADAKTTIRAVDTNHMLICEGDYWATALGQINTSGWTDGNVCYSDHCYGSGLPIGTDRKALCVGANVPLWTGEFGYNSTHWINQIVAECEQADMLTNNGHTAAMQASWGYWTYKAPQFYALAENAQTAGWNALKNYWNSPGTVARPSVTNAYTWLLGYAQASLFSNCLTHVEVVDALTRSNASFLGQSLPYKAGRTIPGRIFATDYDMGADGVAYSDVVYDDEAGLGPGGTNWNSGSFGRDDGVDTTSCTDPSTLLKVGWNQAGEWQRYTVASTPGTYSLNLRYSAGSGGGQLQVLVNGVNVSGTVTLPATGSSTTYSTYTLNNVTAAASGTVTVQIQCDTAGYDLLWVEFQAAGTGPLPPGGVTATPGNGAVSLTWAASSGATSYTVKRANTSGGPYTAIGTATATGYHDTGLANGTSVYYVVAATNAAGPSADSPEVCAAPQMSTLPAAWASRDVGVSRLWSGDAGDVGFAGSASLAGGAYTVTGSGVDIYGGADSFQYAYRAVSGDCTIIARVASIQNTDPWAKAGLMIRETLQFDSVNALVAITPGNGSLFSYRSTTAGTTSSTSQSGAAPYWLKLVRSVQTFTAYRSSDGSSWTQIGSSAVIPMARNVFVGLAVTAHNNLQLSTATFDNLGISVQPPPVPTIYSATASNLQVTLTWSASSGAASYNVKRAATSGGPYDTVATVLASTRCVDSGLSGGMTYYYVVSAVNLNGESADSAEASASFAPPQVLASLDPGGGQLSMSWPAWGTNFTLYATPSLAPPVTWSPVTNTVETQDGALSVTVPLAGGSRFFRLAAP